MSKRKKRGHLYTNGDRERYFTANAAARLSPDSGWTRKAERPAPLTTTPLPDPATHVEAKPARGRKPKNEE